MSKERKHIQRRRIVRHITRIIRPHIRTGKDKRREEDKEHE